MKCPSLSPKTNRFILKKIFTKLRAADLGKVMPWGNVFFPIGTYVCNCIYKGKPTPVALGRVEGESNAKPCLTHDF